MRTKGEMEAAISDAMVQFEIDYMGRGPKEARAHMIEEMVLVRASWSFSKAGWHGTAAGLLRFSVAPLTAQRRAANPINGGTSR